MYFFEKKFGDHFNPGRKQVDLNELSHVVIVFYNKK